MINIILSLRSDLVFCRHLHRTAFDAVQVSNPLLLGDCLVGKNKNPPRNDIRKDRLGKCRGMDNFN